MKTQTLFSSLILILSIFTTSCTIINQPDKLSHIIDMAWQDDKYLWVSYDNKLIRWNTQTKEAETFNDVSGKLLVDSKDTIWTFYRGVGNHLNGEVWEQFTAGNEFADGPIFSFVESDGYIWVGTFGLSRYSQQSQSWEVLLEITPGPMPTPIPEGEIAEILPEGVHSISPAGDGAMWLGTNKGLTYWDDDFQQTWGNNILTTDGIRCLLGISKSEVWICTKQGFGRWNGIELVNFFEDHDDHKELVQGDAQEVWATGDKGVSRWNGFSWDNWTIIQEVDLSVKQEVDLPVIVEPLRSAYSLIVSTANSNVWAASAEGIVRWDGQQWRIYTNDDGLIADFAYVLIQDSKGIPWAGTNNGIYYYEPDTDRWQPFP